MKTIGIFLAGQNGDQITALSVMKYKEELWGKDCKIIWYSDKANFDNFKYQDIELREFPRGFGYPIMVAEENKKLIDAGEKPTWEDWQPLVDENNHLNIELAKNCPSLAGIDLGYFPAPHQMDVIKRANTEYPNISKRVFGVPDNYEWHPVLEFSFTEIAASMEFMNDLPYKRAIAIEAFAGSGQSILSDEQVKTTMQICMNILGKCSFVFVSNKYLKNNEIFPTEILNMNNASFAGNFTVRQTALIVEKCDLLISMSSGITVASSAWELNPTPIIQYCGSDICSTRAMALGIFELVTHDEKPVHVAENEFYERLKLLLNEIK